MEGIKSLFGKIADLFMDYVVFPFQNSDNIFVDILDILFVTLLLYYVYRFIRNRRAGKLAIGVVIFIILFYIVQTLNMRISGTIMNNIFSVGFIALVIIFQNELRDALEKMGSVSTNIRNIAGHSGNKSNDATLEMIDEIVKAVKVLSYNGVGALIVIERNTKLGDYISKGTLLDANVNERLLRNIFVDKSPLHDGALIISNGRIAAAECKLPPSTNEEALRALGTRHRGALGISEVSDAVVVVVSEESKVISVAYNRELTRRYTPETLKSRLYGILTGEELPQGSEDVVAFVDTTGADKKAASGDGNDTNKR